MGSVCPADGEAVCGDLSVREAGGARGGLRALLGLQSKGRRNGASRDDACEHHGGGGGGVGWGWGGALLFAFFPTAGWKKDTQNSSGEFRFSCHELCRFSLPPALAQLSPDLEVTHDLF